MIASALRGGGRSWLAVLLASLIALVAAAIMLQGGVAQLRPSASADLAVAPPVSPTSSASAATTKPKSPHWSAGGAASIQAEDEQPPPRRMLVPRLELDMAIVATGVTADGQMALPNRPSELGWYRYGPRPGDPTGSAVLAGHVDSREDGIGPLSDLRLLREGDRISIQRGGGLLAYEVRQVVLISKRVVPLPELFERSGAATLRIVTCGGPYVQSRGGYLDNLVVTAVPV